MEIFLEGTTAVLGFRTLCYYDEASFSTLMYFTGSRIHVHVGHNKKKLCFVFIWTNKITTNSK